MTAYTAVVVPSSLVRNKLHYLTQATLDFVPHNNLDHNTLAKLLFVQLKKH